MSRLLSLGLVAAFVVALHAGATAADYHIRIINKSDTPVDFAVFQKAPSGNGFVGAGMLREICVPSKENRSELLHAPGDAGILHTNQPEVEVQVRFRESSCAGHVTSTRHFMTSGSGNYTINGTLGHYTIDH